ncbi:hypothetical protein Lal_00023821 [Lupinus albus]|nr:hypothetical protein Lal_00023821 [Lupinus albus]
MVSHILKIDLTYPKQVREEEEELETRVVGFSLKRTHSRSSENLTVSNFRLAHRCNRLHGLCNRLHHSNKVLFSPFDPWFVTI